MLRFVTMSTPAKRTKRSYTDEQIANALAILKSNGGNLLATERDTGIPRQTIREWSANGRRDSQQVREIRQEKEQNILTLYGNAERGLLEHAIKPEIIADMDGLAAMKAAGIARDKIQLMTGQPTSIVEERTIDSLQVLRLLQDSLSQADPLQHAIDITPAPAHLTP